ncbi:MAG: hypothetical protein IPJ88_01040 [Myxococcales bacterium]|nr:MAG: hypothetical protein IPJ88_01040 [Myxococcales bacterium]
MEGSETEEQVKNCSAFLRHFEFDTDKWEKYLEWPPDVFAITSIFLEDTGYYRLIISPPKGKKWDKSGSWNKKVKETLSDPWRECFKDKKNRENPVWKKWPEAKRELLKHWQAVRELFTLPESELRGERLAQHWDKFVALFTIHAAADACCVGFGVLEDEDRRVRRDDRIMLGEQQSLSRFPAELLRVLPKIRTPQSGITIRSLSQHLHVDRSELTPSWNIIEDFTWFDRELPVKEQLNLLLVPWPLKVSPNDFRITKCNLGNLDAQRFGTFKFEPTESFDKKQLSAIIKKAQMHAEVHAVVLPELAVTEDGFNALKETAKQADVPVVIAGMRNKKVNCVRLAETGRDGKTFEQCKHHRWRMDEAQIKQYDLGFALDPRKYWWEDIEIKHRTLQFVVANEWLTICPLICEDLARTDPVARVIRGVGPSLVIALLQDGPQLKHRWSARYATVLAEDPGSSVLTLTSLGMALRSRPDGKAPSRTIGLWKDRHGAQELPLDEDAEALLVNLTNYWQEEWSADGRYDKRTAAEIMLTGQEQIKI